MPQTLYRNGHILSMNSPKSDEALLIEEDKILFCGKESSAQSLEKSDCTIIDLQGHTLMPSFIDAHSHICAFSNTISLVSLQQATTFLAIQTAITTYIKQNNIPPGEWISGFGYDHNSLAEKAHPTKEILDKVAPKNPVLIAHASGHMGVANSLALAALAITKTTKDPVSGKIGKDKTGEPTGYLEETAFMTTGACVPAPTLDEQTKNLKEAEKIYLSYGITTIQEGLMKQAEFTLLSTMAQHNDFTADIVAYADLKDHADLLKDHEIYRTYQNHFKIGGYKIFLDGSPQGKTAYLTQPYNGENGGYRGYPIYEDNKIASFVYAALCSKTQLLAHCNGDAAAQQYINALQQYPKKSIQQMRPVMIHAQLVRRDQLPLMHELGIIPSYFVAHTYYWGDTHLKNLGKNRADYISPAKSTIGNHLPFTFHQDTPVIKPNMLETVWCAVKRQTKEGIPLAQSECITPYEALCAVTKNAAYAYFEEDSKGTLSPGKKADLVILDANPLTVPIDDIRNITVLQTIKDGKVVFKR